MQLAIIQVRVCINIMDPKRTSRLSDQFILKTGMGNVIASKDVVESKFVVVPCVILFHFCILCHSQSFLLDVCHAMVFEKLLTTLSTLNTHEISIPTSMHNAHELFIFKILLRIFCKIYILPNKLM